MVKVIRVLHWVNLTRLFRCHLTFGDDWVSEDGRLKVEHWYLVYPITRWQQKFQRKRMRSGNVRSLEFLVPSLEEIKPDVVITCNVIDSSLMNLMRKNCKMMIYIHHAIWSEEIIENQRKRGSELVDAYSVFDKIFMGKQEIAMFQELKGMDLKKLVGVNGVIYFDEVMDRNMWESRVWVIRKFKLNPKCRVILLIHNTGFHCRDRVTGEKKTNLESSADYGVILDQLVKYAEVETQRDPTRPVHVFTKLKKKKMDLLLDDRIKILHKHSQVTCITPEHDDNLLSKFLFADAVILQGFGTSYLETLLCNKKIAPCFIRAKVTMDVSRYPNMPVIREVCEIQPMVDRMFKYSSSFVKNPGVIRDVDQMMKSAFGTNGIERVTNKVMGEITNFLLLPVSSDE